MATDERPKDLLMDGDHWAVRRISPFAFALMELEDDTYKDIAQFDSGEKAHDARAALKATDRRPTPKNEG